MRVMAWLLCVLTLEAVALGASPPEEAKPEGQAFPNIILITVDTTRADRMGFLGSKLGLTPNLDGLARDGAVFTRAYSQAPLTPTSHATILTGTLPQYHQVQTFLIPLGKDLPYLPDILRAHGYSTGAFVGSLALDPAWGVPGFDRGFDKYGAGYTWEGYSAATRYKTTEHRAAEVIGDAEKWLSEHKQGPFFLWIHVYDPHAPYDPPQPYKTRYAKDLYGGEIAYTDAQLGKFFEHLKASGLYDDAVIAMTSDHGESLGAHGEKEHGVFLYDETIHVPLVIKLPRKAAAGKRVTDRVELVDIMPTFLQSVGIPVPEKVQGQSLLGFLNPDGPAGAEAAKAWRDRGAYSQADYGHIAFAWSALQSLRTGKYLYIQAPRRELYEDAVDTKAEHNLASSSSAVADTLSTKLEDFRKLTTNTGETPKATFDANNAGKLAALGYMAAREEPTLAGSKSSWPDPKDKIQIANTLLQVTAILEEHRCDQAIPAIKKALVNDPSIAMLHFFLGGCYLENEDYKSAIPELRKTVELDPAFTHAQINFGRALLRNHQEAEAAVAFEHAEKTEPNLMNVHVFLEIIYARLNRAEDEIRECRRVLEVVPEHFGSNLNLGQFLDQTGDLQGAIAPLQKAASLRPAHPMPHRYLADVYSRLGRTEDAQRETAEADRLAAAAASAPAAPQPNKGPESDVPERE